MMYRSRVRKRVHAIPRGPDGSAFRACQSCGLSVAIALFDMHECGFKENTNKKLKTQSGNGNVERQEIQDQPRSAFHFFMEEFIKTCCTDENDIERNKKGFEIWKNMSKEERQAFVLQAEKVNSAYTELLLKEENEMQWVDDEADSAEVGKYDKSFEDSMYCYDSGNSGASGFFRSETIDTLDTDFLVGVCPWATRKSP